MNPHDVAAELRARAEKARADANENDGVLYAVLMVEARTYDEAASLVEALLVADSRAEPIQRPDGQGVRTRAAREPATPAPKQAEGEGTRVGPDQPNAEPDPFTDEMKS